MALDLFKAFTVSKIKVYFDGDSQPYLASVTMPSITSSVDSFNNTSLGGEIEIADPFRRMPSGDVEFVFEADSSGVNQSIYSASKIVSVNIAMAQANMQPQLGQFVPIPVNYKLGLQFFEVDPGEIAMGAKREITARAKMFSLKIVHNLITVVDFDFVNDTFFINSEDQLAAVSNIIG